MTQGRTRLDRTAVLCGAREVLDRTGIDGFTTRALAAHLQVRQPGLYWHFPTKADLLSALAADILEREHHASLPEPGEGWEAFLMRNARSFRTALHAVRDGARLHAGYHRRPCSESINLSEAPSQQIRLLVNQGFEEYSAISALIAISRYTVGVVLEEQAGARDEIDKTDNDDTFEFGLTALVDGLAAGLEKPS
jgi:TetR/AcrR family tetracycline transcriptional repressor